MRLLRFLSMSMLTMIVSACSVPGTNFVGSSGRQAMYIAWTADREQHLQGQVQLFGDNSSLAGLPTRTAASFTGTRDGDEVSLVFGLLSSFSGQTWTGHTGSNSLTLDLPNGNEMHLTPGTLADFQQKSALIAAAMAHERDQRNALVAMNGSLAAAQRLAQRVSTAIQQLKKAFPTPAPPRERTMLGRLDAHVSGIKLALYDERTAVIKPLTCLQENQIDIEANTVQIRYGAFQVADTQYGNYLMNSQASIETATQDLASLRSTVLDYNEHLAAYNQLSGEHLMSKMTVSDEDGAIQKAAQFLANMRLRLAARLRQKAEDESQAAAAVRGAQDFASQLTCAN